MIEVLKHIYDLLKSQHFTCYDFHHNKQDQHKPDEICKPLKNFEKVLESLRQIIEQPKQEPVAMRYDFDGYGFKYIDSGSGSDWQTRIKDAESLYTSPLQQERNFCTRCGKRLGKNDCDIHTCTPPKE
jgi:hypothetical protein